MSGRSSLHSLVLLTLLALLVACRKPAPQPEADPADVKKLAAKMMSEIPSPAATRDCTADDFKGAGTPLTLRSLMILAGETPRTDRPEHAAWINVRDLESPDVHALVDNKDTKSARRAAAKLLAAPYFIVYKVDLVNAPMALGLKELKIGNVGTRIIRYEKTGLPGCVKVFIFENDHAIANDAIEKSDRAVIDPAIAERLRNDLAVQFIKLAPRPTK